MAFLATMNFGPQLNKNKKQILIMTKKNLALKNLPSFFCHPAKFN
jgi:hypothetical protein